MKRRYVLIVSMVIALVLTTWASALAQPAGPAAPSDAQPGRSPVVRVGAAWGAIVRGQAAAHNFVRPPREEVPVFTVLPGTRVRLTAGASGLWLGEAGGTLSAHLEVIDADAQDDGAPLGEDSVSDTRDGPAFAKHRLEVPVFFNEPGRVHLFARLTATAEPHEGELAQDVDELEAVVNILDPSTFGSISGQVTTDDTEEGLEGVLVTAGNRELRVHRTTRTDGDGNYKIEGLPPGEYLVGVRAKGTPYMGELYADAHSPDEAEPVTVTDSAETPGIDFGLARGSEISGQVTVTETGEPLAGIPIVVRPMRPDDGGEVAGAAGLEPAAVQQVTDQPGAHPEPGPADPRRRKRRPAAVTGDDGTYVVQGLPAGEYFVAAAGERQGYGVEFWQGAPTPEEATPITVELGDSVSDIDFTLAPQTR